MAFDQTSDAFTSPALSRTPELQSRAAAADKDAALASGGLSLLTVPLASLLREIEVAAESALTCAPAPPEEHHRRLVARYRTLVKVNTTLAKTLAEFRPHLASLAEYRLSPDRPFSQGLPRWQVKRAHEFIAMNLGNSISTADVAAACGLSRSYFTSAFRRATGDTPHLYVLRHRVQRAKELLLGALCIADIALTCGFADQAHFTRTFAKHTGVSPGLWRRERRQGPPQKVRT